jgi:hypothetical protein
MAMFSTASVNVIGFDPNRNTDQARAYASKYCSCNSCRIVTDGSLFTRRLNGVLHVDGLAA